MLNRQRIWGSEPAPPILKSGSLSVLKAFRMGLLMLHEKKEKILMHKENKLKWNIN
jgi:hypothetical protein